MRKPESEKLSTPVPDEAVSEKYIGETEKNLAVDLDKDLSVVVKPWWKRLLRRQQRQTKPPEFFKPDSGDGVSQR